MEPTPLSPELSRIVGPRRTPTRRSAASETLVDRDALPPDVALDPDLVTMLRRHPVVAVPTGPSATSTEAWSQARATWARDTPWRAATSETRATTFRSASTLAAYRLSP